VQKTLVVVVVTGAAVGGVEGGPELALSSPRKNWVLEETVLSMK